MLNNKTTEMSEKEAQKIGVINVANGMISIVILIVAIFSVFLNVNFIMDLNEKNKMISENAYKYRDNLLDYEPTLAVEIAQSFVDDSVKKVDVETNGKYTGSRLNGKKTGTATYVWNNGNVYEGEFKDDLMNGNGKLYIVGKGTYEGKFVNGKKVGKGTYTFTNGDSYTGEWLDDKMEGEGKYTFANGDVYSGNFSNNMFNGYGTYTKDGRQYTGTWKNNSYNK